MTIYIRGKLPGSWPGDVGSIPTIVLQFGYFKITPLIVVFAFIANVVILIYIFYEFCRKVC